MIRNWVRWFLWTLISVSSFSHAAAQEQANAQYSYSGIVINAATGEPVKRAQVQFTQLGTGEGNAEDGRPGQKPPATPLSKNTFSDAGGMFRFDGLPPATYFIGVAKPGFTPEYDPASQSNGRITLKSSVDDARLRLSPLGVIEGKVTGDDGLPLRHISVVAITVRIVDGMRRHSTSRHVATDDRGMYRFYNLQPGKYYLKAAGHSGGTMTYAGDQPPITAAYESFVPVYFGGAGSLMSATPITIKPGSDEHADFVLPLLPAVRIRGKLQNFAQGETVRFELLNGDEEVSQSRVSVNRYSGVFQIHDVVPGAYVLRATQGKLARGEMPIVAGGADVNDVTLVLVPAVDVKLLMRASNTREDVYPAQGGQAGQSNTGARPPGRHDGRVGGMAQPCHPALTPAGAKSFEQDWFEGQISGVAGGDGEFVFKDVLPGSYQLAFYCSAGYVTSAVWGETDLLANPTFSIQPGAALAPIEVGARFSGSSLSGEMKLAESSTGKPPGVLLVPQFANATGPLTEQAFQYGQGDSRPYRFSFRGLAPGDYLVFAFASLEEIEFRNPEFLRGLNGGMSVHIEESGQSNITITSLVR